LYYVDKDECRNAEGFIKVSFFFFRERKFLADDLGSRLLVSATEGVGLKGPPALDRGCCLEGHQSETLEGSGASGWASFEVE